MAKIKIVELIVKLNEQGFIFYKPISNVWTTALVNSFGDTTLCILFRRNGIDFRFFDNTEAKSTSSEKSKLEIIDRIKISMTGGDLYRNFYNNATANIHSKVLSIAKMYVKGKDILPFIKKEEGCSHKKNSEYEELRKLSKDRFDSRIRDMKQDASDRWLHNHLRSP